MKQAKTIRKQKFKKSAFTRTASSYAGAFQLLKLLARAEPSTETEYEVSSVIASMEALELLQHRYGTF